MTLARSFVVFMYALALVACGAPIDVSEPQVEAAQIRRCRSNADCNQLDFCDTEDLSTCGGRGVCKPRGVTLLCPDIFVGVCGCDGVTYANTCQMHKHGVSEAYAGTCAPKCQVNADCDATSYCATPEGECGGEGTCVSRGIGVFCSQLYQPVCGCDGHTYPNQCQANKAGAAVEHAGECN